MAFEMQKDTRPDVGEGVSGDVETVPLKAYELADMLDVSASYLSQAAKNDWLAGGVRVRLYAVLHWKGKRISHYDVPKKVIKDVVPSYMWSDYGIKKTY